MDVSSARKSVGIAAALFLLVGCSAVPTTPLPTPTPAQLPKVLGALPDNAPLPNAAQIASALSAPIKSPALGVHVGVAVADVRSGALLYEKSSITSDDQFIPASAVKLFTAVAVLMKNDSAELVRFKGKSLSLSNLVEITLTESDNSGANLLSKLVPGSVSTEISIAFPTLDLTRTTMFDASGLSRKNRTTPATLVHLLTLIADPGNPQLSPILTGLPIAGLSGTLKTRAVTASGQIRAKTGTLTGVDVLAGYLVDKAKRALAFVVMADRVPKTTPGRKAIDQIATALLELN